MKKEKLVLMNAIEWIDGVVSAEDRESSHIQEMLTGLTKLVEQMNNQSSSTSRTEGAIRQSMGIIELYLHEDITDAGRDAVRDELKRVAYASAMDMDRAMSKVIRDIDNL
jgi:hypothetical protein